MNGVLEVFARGCLRKKNEYFQKKKRTVGSTHSIFNKALFNSYNDLVSAVQILQRRQRPRDPPQTRMFLFSSQILTSYRHFQLKLSIWKARFRHMTCRRSLPNTPVFTEPRLPL